MRCTDCHVCCYEIGEFPFALEDGVWLSTCPSDPEVVLCVGCVERRLGRELEMVDFADNPATYLSGQSERLRNRLSRHRPGVEDLRCPSCSAADGPCMPT